MLSFGEVQVWQIDLALRGEQFQSCLGFLSRDEHDRADRFRQEKGRIRFIAARAALRAILARHLNIAPQEVVFSYAAGGKPELAAGLDQAGLKFNLAHSRDIGLVALTPKDRVGADIEFIDPQFRTSEIARRFFSPSEVDMLRALDPAEQTMAFYTFWTRKEAYVKAVGEGLSLSLDSFDVAFRPGSPGLVRVEGIPQVLSPWSIYSVPAPDGFVASVVIEGTGHNLECRDWEF